MQEQQKSHTPPTDEELTTAFESLDSFLQGNLGIIPVVASAASQSHSITASLRVIAYLGPLYWPKGFASTIVTGIFSGLTAVVSIVMHPKAAWKSLKSAASTAALEITDIKERKKQKYKERADIQRKLGNDSAVPKKSRLIKALIRWAKDKLIGMSPIGVILRASPEQILANTAFQALITNPRMIEMIKECAPVIGEVIGHQLEKVLGKEAKLIQRILEPSSTPLTARGKEAALDILIKLKANGGLITLANIMEAANPFVKKCLAEGGEEHLANILRYLQITVPTPVDVELVTTLISKVLTKVADPGFDLPSLGTDILQLMGDPKKSKDVPEVDKMAVAANILTATTPLIVDILSHLQDHPEGTDWIRQTILSNVDTIATQLEKALPAQIDAVKVGDPQQPTPLHRFLKEAIEAASKTVITLNRLPQLMDILRELPVVLSPITSINTKQKQIAAAFKIGEIVCQFLEDPNMSGFMSNLTTYSSVLVPILTPIIGKNIPPAAFMGIISDEQNRKKLIESFRNLKNSGDTFDSYLKMFRTLLFSGIIGEVVKHKIKTFFGIHDEPRPAEITSRQPATSRTFADKAKAFFDKMLNDEPEATSSQSIPTGPIDSTKPTPDTSPGNPFVDARPVLTESIELAHRDAESGPQQGTAAPADMRVANLEPAPNPATQPPAPQDDKTSLQITDAQANVRVASSEPAQLPAETVPPSEAGVSAPEPISKDIGSRGNEGEEKESQSKPTFFRGLKKKAKQKLEDVKKQLKDAKNQAEKQFKDFRGKDKDSRSDSQILG